MGKEHTKMNVQVPGAYSIPMEESISLTVRSLRSQVLPLYGEAKEQGGPRCCYFIYTMPLASALSCDWRSCFLRAGLLSCLLGLGGQKLYWHLLDKEGWLEPYALEGFCHSSFFSDAW